MSRKNARSPPRPEIVSVKWPIRTERPAIKVRRVWSTWPPASEFGRNLSDLPGLIEVSSLKSDAKPMLGKIRSNHRAATRVQDSTPGDDRELVFALNPSKSSFKPFETSG